ncbi:MAG: hypothetical protein COB20_01465 [SAR86 cluster bacterium]|uniref:Uncharacterized protein n=1 Tax=SAR86 cluster bacterium TaxID=2030880 RepID=A0A2A4XG88_9GAMM|nr:MAG: hypothetical protein COB20_01465 [SAR86 cluster bacterium]
MKNNEAMHYQGASNDAALLESNTRAAGSVFNMDERIHLLASRLSKIVEFDSFAYENETEGVSVSIGSMESHKCSYKIKDGGIYCGEFTLTRNAPFLEEELMIIETAMGSIIHTCHL